MNLAEGGNERGRVASDREAINGEIKKSRKPSTESSSTRRPDSRRILCVATVCVRVNVRACVRARASTGE